MQAPSGRGGKALSEPPSDVPRCGLSITAICAFADAHAGCVFAPALEELAEAEKRNLQRPVPLSFEELTTAQVVQRVVKPATAAARCSYADQLLQQASCVCANLCFRCAA